MPRVLPLLAAAITILAGCVATVDEATPPASVPLSEAVYTALLSEGVNLPSFDGVPLSMQIYRPEVPEGTQVPVIVNFSPYFGNLVPGVRDRGDNMTKYLIDEFVPRGYAVVLASVRGSGESGGCFQMGGPVEIQDSVLTIEWLASQPWSNGKVGAISKSYDGTVANFAAAAGAKGLATIVPVSAITDWYLYLHEGGLPYGFAGSRMSFTPTYYLGMGWGIRGIFDLGDPGPSEGARPDDACPHLAEAAAWSVESGATGNYNAYWMERNYTKDVANAAASMLFIHGLQDYNVNPKMIPQWYNAYPGFKKAILGQWAHHYPARDDFHATLVRWFDSELKGIANGARDGPAVEVQDEACVWRHEADWPPTRATALALYPAPEGALAAAPPADGAVSFTQRPNADPRPNSGAGDNVAFLSAPFPDGIHISGEPVLRFTATSNRPVTAFTAVLYDVSPDGEFREIDWAFLHSGHRQSLDRVELLMPGESAEYLLKFYPIDAPVKPGHSLGLMIASNDIERVLTPQTAATNTVTLGAGTSLSIPTIDSLDVLPTQPATRWVGAYPYADDEREDAFLPCYGAWNEDPAPPVPGPMRN